MVLYPDHGDVKFADYIMNMKEYQVYTVPEIPTIPNRDAFEKKVESMCGTFEKSLYQHFVQHYLSQWSPYRSLLLFHGLGVGKTCSAITVAESLLNNHTVHDGPKVFVVSSEALHKSFEEQIFSMSKFLAGKNLVNQCNGDLYKKLVHGTNGNQQLFRKKVHKLIRSRYTFLTYNRVLNWSTPINNSVIIIDEAHNLRNTELDKAAGEALERLLQTGVNNRLVLLSATPMYNEADEILYLLNLILMNDKRPLIKKTSLFKKNGSHNERTFAIVRQLASEYISYIKGSNPFTMPMRISPKVNGYTTLTGYPELVNIQDFILTSPVGRYNSGTKRNFESAQNFQMLNVYYPGGKTGEKGFSSVFIPVDNVDPIQAAYNPKYIDYLMPGPNLKAAAPKIDKLIDIINGSRGVVIVYSQFVYGGILPIVAALEHMGMRRYSQRNMYRGLSTVKGSKLQGSMYTVITGDHRVNGSYNLTDLLSVINSDANSDGSRIKVVCITPVAGEGLNFRNVREIHILDPWFHMNRLEQVIGRAARTCSHTSLPLEMRNVTVYLHAAVEDTEDTADIHAYKIAARKLQQIEDVEREIRDNALDCALMRNINSFPQDKFKFSVFSITSQGRQIEQRLGSAVSDRPECKHVKHGAPKTPSYRIELYRNLITTLKHRFQNMFSREQGKVYLRVQDFIDSVDGDIEEDIVITALNQAVQESNARFHGNYIILGNGVYLQPEYTIDLVKQDTVYNASLPNLADIPADPNLASIMVYNSINSKNWPEVAQGMINGMFPEAAKVFAANGALITKRELPKIASRTDYVGMVDIFDSTKFVPLIFENTVFRPATDAEVRQIKNNRQEASYPVDRLYGIMYPSGFSKDPSQPLINKLKLFVPGSNKRGAMCAPKKVKELVGILSEIQGTEVTGAQNRDELCYSISYELAVRKFLFTFPLLKPKTT